MKKLIGLTLISLAFFLPYRQDDIVYQVKNYSYQVLQKSIYYDENRLLIMGSYFEKELIKIVSSLVKNDTSISKSSISFAYFDESIRVNKDNSTKVNIRFNYCYLLQKKSACYSLSLKETK